MIDKIFGLRSYLAYRYIYQDGVDFYSGMCHSNIKPVAVHDQIAVDSASDINLRIKEQIDALYKKYDNIGILLSGGMDSANLATYLKPGSHAFTFTNSDSDVFDRDVERAEKYCEILGLNHHLVNISLDDYRLFTPLVMQAKCAPVHSIEPQIYKAATIAKRNGVQLILVGESADLIFGGMDKLISRDWKYDDFVKRYTFLSPELVLQDYDKKVYDLYESYRMNEDDIDYMRFMDDVFAIESSSSYLNAFAVAGIPYYDPYARLVMASELDMNRVRNGEPKYLVRELYAMRYPGLPIPDKIPMPRPVDSIFKDWQGPTRPEFRKDIPMQTLSGNQKWQLWCAQMFLNINEPLA
jgi:asparagine synthetase B (glutamine-hydrolysing)